MDHPEADANGTSVPVPGGLCREGRPGPGPAWQVPPTRAKARAARGGREAGTERTWNGQF